MTVPYTFANQSGNVPASELDANFANVKASADTAVVVTANAQPNITSVGTLTTLSVTGNIAGSYLYGNGSQLTGISSGVQSSITNGTSNVNIATANGNATITANASSTWTFDNIGTLALPGGSRLRPLGANLDIFAGAGSYVNLITSDESSSVGVDGGGGYIVTTGGTWRFDTAGNLTAPGNISAVGNITGDYLFGNGSQLTGVGATSVPSQNILPTIQSIIIANTSSEYETSGGSGYANVLVANVAPVIEYGVIVTAGSTVDKYVTGNLANIPGTEQITISTGTSDQPFTVYAYVTTNAGTYYSGPEVGFSGLCLLKGTMISLADGTYKPIEDINNGDLLLTWDFDLGQYAQARPLWIKRGETGTRYNKLTFSDGTILRTFDQHRIFNKQAGAFTYPISDDTPIGTITVNEHGQEITLVNREIVWDTIEHYNIITDYHINLFADSILTSCRFNNIYPITDMKFVKDVVLNRNLSEFAEIETRFISGLRLQEQSFELAIIKEYVNRLLATEATELISV